MMTVRGCGMRTVVHGAKNGAEDTIMMTLSKLKVVVSKSV